MKRLSILISVIALTMFSCTKEITPGSSDDVIVDSTFLDLKVTELSYPTIPNEGGDFEPTVAYSYTARYTHRSGYRTSVTRTEGADMHFGVDSGDFEVNHTTGLLTAGINMDTDPHRGTVRLAVSKGKLMEYGTAKVTQVAHGDYVTGTYTKMLPLWLEEHECVKFINDTLDPKAYKNIDIKKEYKYITTAHNGKLDRDFAEILNTEIGVVPQTQDDYEKTPECVSVNGVEIGVKGGELVSITIYKSGLQDTTVIGTPVFTTAATYDWWYTWSCSGKKKINDILVEQTPNEENKPSSTYSDGIWKINPIGADFYKNNCHTLTAHVGNMTKSITIKQNNNYPIGEIPSKMFFTEPSKTLRWNERNWADVEDYPPGSKPKYWKITTSEGTGYANPRDSRSLYPDGYRRMHFGQVPKYNYYNERTIFLSGAIEETTLTFRENRADFIYISGIKVTATADAKYTDGTQKTIQHIWEWRHRGTYYANNICILNWPIEENLAEDIIWEVKYEYNLTEKDTLNGVPVSETNFLDLDLTYDPIYIKEHCDSLETWYKAVNFSGFLLEPDFDENLYMGGKDQYSWFAHPDYVDGVATGFVRLGE